MDLSKFLPGLNKAVEGDEEPEMSRFEYHRLHAPKHGPARTRFMSSGQVRRAQARFAAAQNRKTNKRFRREWMANEAAFSTLRSQLLLLQDRPQSALVPGVTKTLVDRYGSVEDAQARFKALVAERQQAARRSA